MQKRGRKLRHEAVAVDGQLRHASLGADRCGFREADVCAGARTEADFARRKHTKMLTDVR